MPAASAAGTWRRRTDIVLAVGRMPAALCPRRQLTTATSQRAADLNRDVADELHRAEDLAKPKDPKSILGTFTSVIGKGAGLILSFDVKTVLNIETSKLNGIVDKYTGILGASPRAWRR
ncbi:hypothetical protein ACIBRY_14710 [Streptomyces anulatus]